jgi:hypothetical protein
MSSFDNNTEPIKELFLRGLGDTNNKNMPKGGSVYSERGVPLSVLTSDRG